MKKSNMKHNGFTLVELIMVLVLVGLISSLAIPRYMNRSDAALAQAKKDTSRAVKTAMIMAMADTHTYPDMSKLASYVQADRVKVVNEGLTVTRKGDQFTVLTYRDSNCSQHTQTTRDIVQCVGSVP